jgi:hypothetical protein
MTIALYPSYINLALSREISVTIAHFFYHPCFAWILPMQMWSDLKIKTGRTLLSSTERAGSLVASSTPNSVF